MQSRLSPLGRAVSHVIFDGLSLAFCVLLLWQLVKFEIFSQEFGDQAPTYLATPLWIPRMAMVIGAVALCFSMLLAGGRYRNLESDLVGRGEPAVSPEFQIIITFAVFLVLLTCGMAVPFAIAVPAVFYLLLQGGLPSLNSLGLVSWGSMNSFVLTCVPLFMLMAEILRVSGLSNRIMRGSPSSLPGFRAVCCRPILRDARSSPR